MDNNGGFPFLMRAAIAAVVGGILFLFMLLILSYSFGLSALAGILMAIIVYFLLGMAGDPPKSKYGGPNGDGAVSTSSADTAAAAPSAPTPAAAPEASSDPEPTPAEETTSAEPDSAEPIVKPSKPLAGQEELAARKGTWKYNADDDSDADGEGGSTSAGGEPAVAEAAASSDAASGEDYDGDGVKEGSDEGTRPEALDGPRDGKADNLKEIKGIGPKLEKLCNSLGFYHFDQIANWTDDEVAWVNANLVGFKGRVSRDEWVKQAKILAAGGETEFSKRVEDGDVY